MPCVDGKALAERVDAVGLITKYRRFPPDPQQSPQRHSQPGYRTKLYCTRTVSLCSETYPNVAMFSSGAFPHTVQKTFLDYGHFYEEQLGAWPRAPSYYFSLYLATAASFLVLQ